MSREHRARPLVAIRWTIARAAAVAARPDLVGSDGPPVELEWRVQAAEGGRVRGGAWLVDGATSTEILGVVERGFGAWVECDDRTVHIDLPGVLSASLRTESGGVRLLYARTALMGNWGIPGGRYEVVGRAVSDGWVREPGPNSPRGS